jgi:hypothetical protein
MLKALRELWEFAIAVTHRWGVLMTSGVVVASIAVYEHLSQSAIFGWPLWVAICVALFAAFFLAWRDEHHKRIAADEELRKFKEAASKLKIEIQERSINQYVDTQNFTSDGSIINLKVSLLNRRTIPITIKAIELTINVAGQTYLMRAEEGEIYESRYKSREKSVVNKGAQLNNLCMYGAESLTIEQDRSGWFQFFLLGLIPQEIIGSKATLVLTDLSGEQHPVETTLQTKPTS